MDQHGNLQDWELVSDSETDSLIDTNEIIHSDYFSLDTSQFLHDYLGNEDFGFSEKDSMEFGYETEKGAPFNDDDGNKTLGLEEIESSSNNFDKGGYFVVNELDSEVDMEGISKGDSFEINYDEFNLGLGFGFEETSNRHPFHVDEVKLETSAEEVAECFNEETSKLEEPSSNTGSKIEEIHAIDSDPQFSAQKIQEDDSKQLVDVNECDRTNENSEEPNIDASVLMNTNDVSVNNDGEKTLIWWKLPLDILRVFACRIKPVWTISIAAAFIGILMVRRKLYNMKHKRRTVPLKISFEDKKAASKLLVQAARLNEVIVRRVPIMRSPMLPSTGGLTPWPVIGLY